MLLPLLEPLVSDPGKEEPPQKEVEIHLLIRYFLPSVRGGAKAL